MLHEIGKCLERSLMVAEAITVSILYKMVWYASRPMYNMGTATGHVWVTTSDFKPRKSTGIRD